MTTIQLNAAIRELADLDRVRLVTEGKQSIILVDAALVGGGEEMTLADLIRGGRKTESVGAATAIPATGATEERGKGRNGSKSSNNSGSNPWERENRGHLRSPQAGHSGGARAPRRPLVGLMGCSSPINRAHARAFRWFITKP